MLDPWEKEGCFSQRMNEAIRIRASLTCLRWRAFSASRVSHFACRRNNKRMSRSGGGSHADKAIVFQMQIDLVGLRLVLVSAWTHVA